MTASKNTIVVYEHDKLEKCKEDCAACTVEYCISHCNFLYFQELRNYCLDKNIDCGFDYLPKDDCIKFDKYTGIIQLQDGTYLEILPKIEKNASLENSRKIFENLIFAAHHLTKEYKQSKNTHSEMRKDKHILEVFIFVFCRDISALLKKGIKKSYIRKTENLPYYKGKLNFSEHINHNIVLKNKFFVDYSDFCQDIPENRILKSACLYLMNKTNFEDNKKIIKRFLIEFADVSVCTNLDRDLQETQLNRLHAYYARPLQYAEFFLRHDSFMPFKGRKLLPALLFPLNELFEDYIENLLKDYKIKKDNKIDYHIQYSKYNLISTGELFNTRMDFVIFKGDNALVLDAKWKVLNVKDNELEVSQADLYQLYSYAAVLRKKNDTLKAVSAALLYPQTSDFCQIVKWTYFDGTPIYLVPVNVLDAEDNSQLFEIIGKS